MKHICTILALSLALPLLAAGEEVTTPDTSQSILDGLEVRPFAYIATDDFTDRISDGGGIGISYFVFANVGIEYEAWVRDYELDGPAIDRSSANVIFNAPVGDNLAFRPFGGGDYNHESDEYGFHVGLRTEARIYGGLWASVDGRWNKEASEDWATFTGGLSYKF